MFVLVFVFLPFVVVGGGVDNNIIATLCHHCRRRIACVCNDDVVVTNNAKDCIDSVNEFGCLFCNFFGGFLWQRTHLHRGNANIALVGNMHIALVKKSDM